MTDTQLEAMLEARDAYVSDLAHGNRRERQRAAHGLNLLAQEDASVVAEVADELISALEHTEAQTQWECLNALAEIAMLDPYLVEDAFPVAEELLFEDGSAVTRMAAFRFVARYGAHGSQESERSWPLLSEAVQCYHGDSEYRNMLQGLLEFAHGSISDDVRALLAKRMSFDAKNGRGFIRTYSAEIVAAAKEE